jgi:hypothetical protein
VQVLSPEFDLDQGAALVAKAACGFFRTTGEPMALNADGVSELLERCRTAHVAGLDFPTIWNQIVRTHPLVLGLPVQVITGSEPQLRMQLINGQSLCFGNGDYFLA